MKITKQFLCFGIVLATLTDCLAKHIPNSSLDSFSIHGYKYYAECVYQQMRDSLYTIKCLRKENSLIIITENKCLFDNDILSFQNVNGLANRYKEFNCEYDTVDLPYYFLYSNDTDSILYIKDPVSKLFTLNALCIQDALLSFCDIAVGMEQSDFLQKIIPDIDSLAQEKTSIVYVVFSHEIRGFAASYPQSPQTKVMIAYFNNDILTKFRLDGLWPTNSSFVKETPIIDRF